MHPRPDAVPRAVLARRALAVSVWAMLFWLLLTWTVEPEQVVFGAILAVLVGVAMAPLGELAGPWVLLRPRRAAVLVWLTLRSLAQIITANVGLARRIWTPARPLRSGMIAVPTIAHTDGELAAVGLISSLIVDNQIIDLDRNRSELQYHCISVPDRHDREEEINAPIERLLRRMRRP